MDSQMLESHILAGKIAADAMKYAKDYVKPGIALIDIADRIESMIKEKAELAFPVNLSLNNIAAHYTPYKGDPTCIKEDDVLKLDIGVHVNGWIADTAVTLTFNKKWDDIVKASREALDNALEIVKPGCLVSKISSVIEETIKGYGFNPVSNLTGHGLERYHLHANPQIPNIKTDSHHVLIEDEVIAIEPFATNGSGYVKETEPVLIFMLMENKAVRNPDARTILRYAEGMKGLPFAERWLPISTIKSRIAMRELRATGAIYDYAPLKEVSGGIVSQAEHSVIVQDPPIVLTR